jgi:hypothetical protein
VTRVQRILIAVAASIGVIVFFVIAFMVGRGCAPEPEPDLVIVTPPDGGEAARVIEERLDAAVVQHAEEVRVIERRIIVQRDTRAAQIEAEERAVRARGREALAAWLAEFNERLRDAGVTDGGS